MLRNTLSKQTFMASLHWSNKSERSPLQSMFVHCSANDVTMLWLFTHVNCHTSVRICWIRQCCPFLSCYDVINYIKPVHEVMLRGSTGVLPAWQASRGRDNVTRGGIRAVMLCILSLWSPDGQGVGFSLGQLYFLISHTPSHCRHIVKSHAVGSKPTSIRLVP